MGVKAGSDESVAKRIIKEHRWFKRVAGVAGELAEEHHLRAGVALSEAVDDIDFTPGFRKFDDELLSRQTFE